MNKKLKEKTKEALSSVLPISIIVFLVSVYLGMSIETVMMFFIGALMLILGMGFFTLGVDISMQPLGESMGASLTKSKKLIVLILCLFAIGFVVTAAEPDLAILAEQVSSVPNTVLIMTVSAGVGIFLMISVLRLILKISLSRLLIWLYILVFAVSLFTPAKFLAVAFDSGGVTTGPITVPFIMSFGLGITMMFGSESSDDSFGFVALCSVGPILAVMILGIIYNPENVEYSHTEMMPVKDMREVAALFAGEFPRYIWEVLKALLPIIALFCIYQAITRKFHKIQLGKMFFGMLYMFLGLVLFFTGVNVGFIPAGNNIGSQLGASEYKWLLMPVGMAIGFFIVAAEPAVHILNKQVEEVSGGAIPQRAMKWSLSLGVAVSLGLSMLRILTGISIYWLLVPGYLIALVMACFAPKIFTGIAFDSGGVASGPMTSTFILPFAMGACEAVGGDVLTDAFGVVAMVAMTPLITIQVMGLIYKFKTEKDGEETPPLDEATDGIVDFEENITQEKPPKAAKQAKPEKRKKPRSPKKEQNTFIATGGKNS
jgi:hypothetical protein